MKTKPKLPLPLLAAMGVQALPAPAAHAYIGPGVATGTVVLVLGVLGALLLWVFALVWYPCKRLWRRWRGSGRRAGQAERAGRAAEDAAGRTAAPPEKDAESG